MPPVGQFVAIRRRFCLALVIAQVFCGVLLCTAGGLELRWTGRGICQDYNGAVFVSGFLFIISGCLGSAAYLYDSPKRKSSSDLFRTFVLAYVVLNAIVVLPMMFQSYLGQCVMSFHRFKEVEAHLLATLIVKLVATYLALLVAVLGIAFIVPDVAGITPSRTLGEPNGVDSIPIKVEVERTQPTTKHIHTVQPHKQQALQLPEAKTHIQEAIGCEEKVTVVTLPEAEGVIYAVPEQSYVIRRGEATYVAPPGNKRLTLFFPTYTKVESD